MIYKIINYDSGKVHYARAARGDIARMMAAEDVSAESWYHWRTVCGRELIGHSIDQELPVSCTRCVRGFEKAQKTYADLNERFGVGTG
jgi:hypothetical protein